MKIEIDYNGAFAVCRIEPMDEPGKMVNFNEADTKSQRYALSAFRTIEEHWRREKQLEWYKKLPVTHIRREFQVMPHTFDQIQELSQQGIIQQWSYDVNRAPPSASCSTTATPRSVRAAGWCRTPKAAGGAWATTTTAYWSTTARSERNN